MRMVIWMSNLKENVIEWITGDDRITLTLTQPRYITKVLRIVEHYANLNDNRADVLINPDGSVFAHLPIECLKLSPKRIVELREDQKDVMRERVAAARAKKAQEATRDV